MFYKSNKQMMDAIRGRLGTFTPKVVNSDPEVIETKDEFADPDFESMKKADLAGYAHDLGIEVPKKATKADIITLIKEAE